MHGDAGGMTWQRLHHRVEVIKLCFGSNPQASVHTHAATFMHLAAILPVAARRASARCQRSLLLVCLELELRQLEAAVHCTSYQQMHA
jgi:hypothetical protein